MTQFDPNTRLLSRDELSNVLRVSGAIGCSDSYEEETRVYRRAPQRSDERHAVAEPLTELGMMGLRQATPSCAGEAAVCAQDVPVRRSRLRLVLAVALPIVALVGAGAASRSYSALPAPRPRPAEVKSREGKGGASRASVAAPVALLSSPPLPSRTAAVEQLISGRVRDALDSYRALALSHADEPAFAFVVAQLERELAECRRDPESCSR